jgi:hypothetical protein
MKTTIAKLGLLATLCASLGACIGTADDGQADDAAGSDVRTEAAGGQEAVDEAPTGEGAVSDVSDGDLAGSIMESSEGDGADASYVTCTGWENGGYICLALCYGMSGWQNTGYSYPGITYGQCGDKAKQFCNSHWSDSYGACWGKP